VTLATLRADALADDDVALKPPLKWAGGKRWLVPQLEQLYAPHRGRRLVEPFVGGLSVALGLRPARALLGDVNVHVVNFYAWIQRGLSVRIPARNDERLYYHHRTRFNALTTGGESDGAEAAQLFYFLNRTGYNGLCRFNSKGEFNVPFGRYATIHYERDFHTHRGVLSSWTFRPGSFETTPLEPGDFIYADPPYDMSFTQYASTDFGWADQVALAEWLARHAGPVVASNLATPRIMSLYERLGFQIAIVKAPRRISCTGDRAAVQELLATRNLAYPASR